MSEERDVYTLDTSGAIAELRALRTAVEDIAGASKESGERQEEAFFSAAASMEVLRRAYETTKELVLESVKAYAESERAERMLASVAGENTEAFLRQAKAFQETLGVSDDMVERLQTMALRFGAAPGQVEALTKAVLDYSAATGTGPEEAMRLLLNSVEAGTDGLRRMGVQYISTGEKTKDMTRATQALADKYGGAAATAAGTLEGKQRQLHETLEDVEKSFGKLIASLETELHLIDKVAFAIKDLTYLLSDENKQQKEMVARTETMNLLRENEGNILAKMKTAKGKELEDLKSQLTYVRSLIAAQRDLQKAKSDAAVAAAAEEKKTPTGTGTPGLTAKAVQEQEAARKKRLEDIKKSLAEEEKLQLEADRKQYLEAGENDEKLADLKRDGIIKLNLELKKRNAERMKDEKGASADRLKIAEEENKAMEGFFEELQSYAKEAAQFALGLLKEQILANQQYTSQLRAADVDRRANEQATAELQAKYGDERLKQLSDQRYSTELLAQADADRASIAKKLEEGEAAAMQQRLAEFLAGIAEQAALKAALSTADGLAKIAGGATFAVASLDFEAAAAYAAVAAAAGGGAAALAQNRGLTTEESDNLASLKAQNDAAGQRSSGSPGRASGSGGSSGNGGAAATVVNVNYYGIAGFTKAQQAAELNRVTREYARLKTGAG